ncbi:MAG: hypothetical protein ABW224_15735 [Kibdelosporangium sp.]
MTGDWVAERARLIEKANRLQAERRDISPTEYELREQGEHQLAEAASKHDRHLLDRINKLRHEYRKLVPAVPIARCPHSGDLLHWFLDTAGLDGWAWEYSVVGRQPANPPRLWLATNGAMRLSEPAEFTWHQVKPGPGVPYVVPRILRCPDVRAVLNQVQIGRHTGWTISYFGPRPATVTLVNNWGKFEHHTYDDNGEWRGWNRDEKDESTGQYDFDLSRWLESGKLLWINPGDDSATLHSGTAGCPYRDLPGERRCSQLLLGKVWRPGDPT